jgi:uncharacterized protein (TIGR03435 family)
MRWALLFALAVCAAGQSFEVVSIKPNPTDDFRQMRLNARPGGRFSATAIPPGVLLVYAYNLPMNQSERLVGLPDWTKRERFDVEAKGATDANVDTMRRMVQRLLADQLHLAIRKESKEVTVYALTVAPGGPKISKPEMECAIDSPCHSFNGGMGRGLHAKAASMDDLAGFIENWTDHPVVNRTGLQGLFAIESEGWTPMRAPIAPAQPVNPVAPPSGDGDMTDPGRPTLFMVLKKLGWT